MSRVARGVGAEGRRHAPPGSVSSSKLEVSQVALYLAGGRNVGGGGGRAVDG